MITLLVRTVSKATVQTPVTHSAGWQTLSIGTLKFPGRAQGCGGGRAAELLIWLVRTVWVSVTTQSQVQTWSTVRGGVNWLYSLLYLLSRSKEWNKTYSEVNVSLDDYQIEISSVACVYWIELKSKLCSLRLGEAFRNVSVTLQIMHRCAFWNISNQPSTNCCITC